MKINKSIAKLSLKSSLYNRSSIFILLLQSIIPVLVMFYLWSGILNGNREIGGLTNSQMITYYVGVNFINFFIWYAIDWELNNGNCQIFCVNRFFSQIDFLIFYLIKVGF